jgi:hypothetical protein
MESKLTIVLEAFVNRLNEHNVRAEKVFDEYLEDLEKDLSENHGVNMDCDGSALDGDMQTVLLSWRGGFDDAAVDEDDDDLDRELEFCLSYDTDDTPKWSVECIGFNS